MGTITIMDFTRKPGTPATTPDTLSVKAYHPSWADNGEQYDFYVDTGNYCKRAQLIYMAVSRVIEPHSGYRISTYDKWFLDSYAAIHSLVYMFQYGVLNHRARKYYRLMSESWTLEKALKESRVFLEMGYNLSELLIKGRPMILNMMDPVWWLTVREALKGTAGRDETDILEAFSLIAKPSLVRADRPYYRELCKETCDTYFTGSYSRKSLGGATQEFFC